MYTMDLGEREQAPGSTPKPASKKPAAPEKVAAPPAVPKPSQDKAERTWAARRKGCPEWADNVEPF